MVNDDGDQLERQYQALKADHSLHWLMLVLASGYAWMLHGFWVALAVLIGLIIAISVSNLLIIGNNGSLKAVKFARWTWLVIAFAALAFSSASIEQV